MSLNNDFSDKSNVKSNTRYNNDKMLPDIEPNFSIIDHNFRSLSDIRDEMPIINADVDKIEDSAKGTYYNFEKYMLNCIYGKP